MTEISEVLRVENGEVKLNPLFRFRETGESPDGKVLGSLEPTGNELQQDWKLKMAGLA
ncbi:hypothetical protein LJK88_29130 [Paenibacillus sp. P26]|nr:hypothetical protein LJK88_29130 [Paenibacillus sp. P26]